jgi:hypothetical protein
MNTTRKIVGMIALVIMFVAVNLSAQTPPTENSGGGGGGSGSSYAVPDKIPLSPSALKAYALTQVKKINVQVWGRTVQGDNYRMADYPFADCDPGHMASIAGSQVLRYSATTDDRLTSFVSYDSGQIELPDPDNSTASTASFTLFHGEKTFMLELQKGGWGVPADAMKIELKLASSIPIVIPGMQNAYITTYDEDGNPTGWFDLRDSSGNYWMDRGVIFLDSNIVSHSGTFTLIMKDGTKHTYDMGTGDRKPTESIRMAGFLVSVLGARTVPTDTTEIVYSDTDEVVTAKFTKDATVRVTFPSDLKRYPEMVRGIDANKLRENPQAKWTEFNPYTQPVEFQVTAGQAIILGFDYPKDMSALNNGGGKG